MTPPIASPDQMDLLDWQPPEVVARFEERAVRAATVAARISHGVAQALRDAAAAGLDRAEVARRMSRYLGETITPAMLNGYASEAREERVVSVVRLLALVAVTGDRRLLQMLAEPFEWAVIEARHLPLIEIAAIRERADELQRRADALRHQMGRRQKGTRA